MNRYTLDGWFDAMSRLVEERIRQAQEEGQFDDLPGKGKPLKLDDDSSIAPHLRTSYRILKNAGILPPQMQIRKDINELRQLLDESTCEEDAKSLVAQLNEKIMACNIMGRLSVSTGMDQIYSEKLVQRLKGKKSIQLRRLKSG